MQGPFRTRAAAEDLGLQREQIDRWWDHPDEMVRDLFKVEPDPWQDEVLQAFPHKPREAMKASKGPGKSAALAWCAWNFLLTRPFPNVAATSISGDNLRDGLWKEMAVWRSRCPILQREFEMTTERIFHREHRETWFMSARTWPKAATTEELGNTLAGLHADYILFLLDEAGSMPVAILAAAEAALSSCVEGHILVAGNTNSLDGALYHACVKQARMWHTVTISGDPDDPKRSTRISLEWAKEMVATYGRDSPFIKVMVLGQWPDASINALLSANEVEEAFGRKYQDHDIANSPRVLGVDVARDGINKSVLFPRQGLVAFPPKVMMGATGLQGAGQVARVWRDWDLDACFIDATGGFGASWIDQLRVLNREPVGVHFASKAADEARYFNKRTEMIVSLANWIKAGGALPYCPELLQELPAITYTFKGDRMLIEPKELIAEKIGHSPDHSDGLCLTFAEPVASRARKLQPEIPRREDRERSYNPIEEFMRNG